MKANIKTLLKSTPGRLTKELIENHIKEIIVDIEKKNVTIMIDNKHILNKLLSENNHKGDLFIGVKKGFGDEYNAIIRKTYLSDKNGAKEHHDREMNIPHTIHY